MDKNKRYKDYKKKGNKDDKKKGNKDDKKQKEYNDFNGFDNKSKSHSNVQTNILKNNKNNSNVNNLKSSQKNKINNDKNKRNEKKYYQEIKYIQHKILTSRRNKSEEKRIHGTLYKDKNLYIESSDEESKEKSKLKKFNFAHTNFKKVSDKIDEFPLFSDITKHRETFHEQNIKTLLKDSSKIQNYECIYSKNEKLKKLDINSLIKTKEAFDENKTRLKLGVSNYIKNFEKIMLFKYNFSFDDVNSKKLDIFVDNKDDIKLDYFSKDNDIFTAYQKKNIKSMILDTNEDILKPVEEIKIDNDSDIFGSIEKINQRWLNKKKLTRQIQKPDTDNFKICFNFNHALEIPSIGQSFQEFVKQKIKTMGVSNDIIKKPIIDFTMDNFVTEIYFSFKEDNKTTQKINNTQNEFPDNSLNQMNDIYNKKYFYNMNIKSEYLPKCNIDELTDINIEINYEKFKKWKNERINRKNKYLCSGEASIELMKSCLIDNKFNNPNTSLLHNLSIQLNEINNKNNNDNGLNLTMKNKSANVNYFKCAKKLQDEIDLSLSNKNTFNSKISINKKNKSDNFYNKKRMNRINLMNKENEEKNSEYLNMMKQRKKNEDEMNKKRRKIYVNKIKQQQDNNYEQEIKKEKRSKIIYPIFIVIISLILSVYKHYSNDN